MKLKLLVSGLVVLGAFLAVGHSAPPQDEQEAEKAKFLEMMATMQKLATPGPEHAQLGKLVGTWETKSTFTMPGLPPMVSKGEVTYRPMLGGRFIVGESKSSMMVPGPNGPTKETFEGFHLMGYDNGLKQFQSAWCDSMGTGIYTLTGKADESGKVITYDGIAKDAMTPDGRPWRMVVRHESDDEHTMEMYESLPEGKKLSEKPMGTITETRKK